MSFNLTGYSRSSPDMSALADGLGEHGGSVRVISDTFGLLFEKVE